MTDRSGTQKTLGQQISYYQRHILLLGGVHHKASVNKASSNPFKILELDQGSRVIDARRSQLKPSAETYEEFFADPMGIERSKKKLLENAEIQKLLIEQQILKKKI